MARAKRHYIPGYVWHTFELWGAIAPFGNADKLDSGQSSFYIWVFIGWRRLGLGDATAAAQYVVTHPQTSHNPTNFDFLLDSLSKSEFLSFILKPTEGFYDAKDYNAGS